MTDFLSPDNVTPPPTPAPPPPPPPPLSPRQRHSQRRRCAYNNRKMLQASSAHSECFPIVNKNCLSKHNMWLSAECPRPMYYRWWLTATDKILIIITVLLVCRSWRRAREPGSGIGSDKEATRRRSAGAATSGEARESRL